MDKFFESKALLKLQAFGDKVGSNKAVDAIQGAFMGSMGIIMAGAFFQLLVVIPANFGLISQESELYLSIYGIYNLTMNFLSVWFVFQLG